jgi:hypothetical protein
MIIAPAAPNVLLIIVFGLGMGLGLLAGPSDWWLTWLHGGKAVFVGRFVAVLRVTAAWLPDCRG